MEAAIFVCYDVFASLLYMQNYNYICIFRAARRPPSLMLILTLLNSAAHFFTVL